MKKLIKILSAIALLSSSASGVVACKPDTTHKNSAGNSIFAYLPLLDNGQQNPDVVSVWSEMTPFEGSGPNAYNPNFWDGKQRADAAIKVLRILNVAILAEVGSGTVKLAPQNNKAGYNGSLQNALTKDWSDLKTAVNNEVNAEKAKYKNQYGKDWEKQYNTMLKNDYDSSENNYRAYLFASGDTNASTLLTTTLNTNYQSSFARATTSNIQSNYQIFKNSKETWSTWAGQNQEWAREILLSSTNYISSFTAATKYWDLDNKGQLSLVQVEDATIGADPVFVNSVPVKTYNSQNGKYNAAQYDPDLQSQGLLSPWQKFLFQQWYKNENPLAVSDISIPFISSPTSGVSGLYNPLTDVNDLFTKPNQTILNNVLTKLHSYTEAGSNTKSPWTDLHNADITKINYESKLLTIDAGSSGGGGSGSNDDSGFNTNYVNSVYGALPYLTTRTATPPVTNIPASWTGASGVASGIDRTVSATGSAKADFTSGKMFKVYNIGRSINGSVPDRAVIYVDDTGVHIVHVDGLADYLNTQKTAPSPSLETVAQATDDANNFQTNISPKIAEIAQDENPSLFMGALRTTKFNPTTADSNSYSFNQGITNKYLQFLVDQSWIDQTADSSLGLRYQFNAITSLQSYATFNSSTSTGNHLYFQWIYDFFQNYYNKIVAKPVKDWTKTFVTIDSNSFDWFQQSIHNFDTSLKSYPLQTAIANNNSANEKIAAGGPKPSEGQYPTGTYWNNNFVAVINYLLQNQTNGYLWEV